MKEAQIELQNALTTTFLANLVFLSEYDNELYHRVDELSRMIENGSYKEKYALEFIMESGDFDVYDIVNNKYLYDKNPKKINDELVEKVDFDEKNAIFDLPEYFLFRTRPFLNKDDRFNYELLSEFIQSCQYDMWEYANELEDFLEKKKKGIKKIEKFIFLGTLLGRHIPEISKKIDASLYLVLEKNLEIFRLSLFTVDYTILGEKGVIFSIMDNKIEEEAKIRKFISILNIFDNYLLKFSTTNINISSYIDSIIMTLLNSNPTNYHYSRQLYCLINRDTKVLQSNYKTLMIKDISEKCNFFEDIPVLYLAGGPSLNENIEWIIKNQDKFFIVTIGAVYKKLLKNNIRIDMITTLDESNTFDTLQFDDESVKMISKNTIILASTITNPKVLKKFDQNNLFLYEVMTSFHEDNIAFSGFSIGEITLDILLKMNIKKMYLIGLDLALNQDTGLSHDEDSSSGVYKVELDLDQTREVFHHKKSFLKVRGNLKKEVYTTGLLFSSIKSLEYKLKSINNKSIYNLSVHGAYFSNTIPTKIENLDLKEFFNLDIDNSSLRKFFEDSSRSSLSEKAKDNIEKQLILINKTLKDNIYEIKNTNFKSLEEFINKMIYILLLIQKEKNSTLRELIINYYLIVIPYLKYHFNDKKLKNRGKKLKNIKNIFIRQIENILNDYVFCIDRLKN